MSITSWVAVLKAGSLENADLANKDLVDNTDVSQTLKKITAFARERIMAAMNLNALVRLFFFFCYLKVKSDHRSKFSNLSNWKVEAWKIGIGMQRFWATDGHRKCTVFLFYLSWHYHIYIFKFLCASRDDYFENLGETFVLACKMFTSGCRPWLKNVACLISSLISGLQRDSNPWPPLTPMRCSSCETTHWERGQFVEFISSSAVKWCEMYMKFICTAVVDESEKWSSL